MPLKPDDVLRSRYLIKRFISQGGMGNIYQADDQRLEGRLAAERCEPGVAGDGAVAVDQPQRFVLVTTPAVHAEVHGAQAEVRDTEAAVAEGPDAH